jgi:hypothetical protein
MQNPLSPVLAWYQALNARARRLVIAGAALLSGLILAPWFIFIAGRLTLGPYGKGGPFSLWADFLRGLLELNFAYWFAALGPLLIVTLITLWRKLCT